MIYNKQMKKISGAFISYISLLVRKEYTTKYYGDDLSLDNHLRHIAVERIFNLDLRKEEKIDIDEDTISQIKSKISPDAESLIQQEISNFAPFKSAILEISKGQLITIKPSLLKIVRKRIELSRKLSDLRNLFLDSNTFKADITYGNLIKTLTLISPALVLGGLIRQAILARAFDFDLGLVFTIGDYISSSLTTIIHSILPLITMAIGGFWGFHDRSRMTQKQKENIGKLEDRLFRIFNINIIVITSISYFIDKKSFFKILPISIVILSIILLPNLVKRYFKNGVAVFIVTVFALTYFGFIFSNTMLNVYSIKSDVESFQYIIKKDEIDINPKNLVLVTSGSYYKVFWDKIERETILIKSDLLIGLKKQEKP
jgi:hypothetical protein